MWKKSTFSSDGDCVEVQLEPWDAITVRNTERPNETVEFSFSDWEAFLLGAYDGQFTLNRLKEERKRNG